MTTQADDDVWTPICALADLPVERGVTALVRGHAVAVFLVPDGSLYALGNHDPSSRSTVLGRGIVGVRDGVPFVASPSSRRAFDLRTGECLDDSVGERPGVRREDRRRRRARGPPEPPVTLVVLAHGSANPAGIRVVEAVAARVRYRLPGVPVRTAYVEISRPSLAEVLADGLTDGGRDGEADGETDGGGTAVVVPLLCARDHAVPDPATPARGTLVAAAVGPQRLLAGVMAQRLRAAGARRGQPVVLLGRRLGGPVRAGRRRPGRAAAGPGLGRAGTCRPPHRSGPAPVRGGRRLPAARGHPAAVAPYLVAPGQFLDRARAGARRLGLEVLADVLGDHPHVAEAVARRTGPPRPAASPSACPRRPPRPRRPTPHAEASRAPYVPRAPYPAEASRRACRTPPRRPVVRASGLRP